MEIFQETQSQIRQYITHAFEMFYGKWSSYSYNDSVYQKFCKQKDIFVQGYLCPNLAAVPGG